MKQLQSLVLILLGSVLVAQSVMAGEASYFLSDFGDYLISPTQWDGTDWLQFGAVTGGVLLLADQVDDHWKKEMVSKDHPSYYEDIARVSNHWGEMETGALFMLGVYGYGKLSSNSTYVDTSYNMLQSVVYAKFTTDRLKGTFGRVRPNEAQDASDWFEGGHSFPSGHTTLAFAMTRSYLNSLDSPSIATQALFYGLATGTAFARTYYNMHWVSDVVAGAAVGIYAADFVHDQHKKRHGDISYAPFLWSEGVGVRVTWR